MTVWVVWEEMIGGTEKFHCILANVRTVENHLKAACSEFYRPTEVHRTGTGHQIRYIGLRKGGLNRIVVTCHDVSRDEPPQLEGLPEGPDEVSEVVVPFRTQRLAWTREVIGTAVTWYSQAEPDFPDGRFSIIRDDKGYVLFSLEPDAPSGHLMADASLDRVMQFAEDRYAKLGVPV